MVRARSSKAPGVAGNCMVTRSCGIAEMHVLMWNKGCIWTPENSARGKYGAGVKYHLSQCLQRRAASSLSSVFFSSVFIFFLG